MASQKKGRTVVEVRDIDRAELKQVEEFKYLGSEVKRAGGATGAVKQRIKVAWMKWREVAGIICGRKMPKKLNVKCIGRWYYPY